MGSGLFEYDVEEWSWTLLLNFEWRVLRLDVLHAKREEKKLTKGNEESRNRDGFQWELNCVVVVVVIIIIIIIIIIITVC